MSVPITNGTGASSVAAELVGTLQYQRIEVMGQGGASVLGVNPDASLNVSIIGIPRVTAPAGSVMTVAQLAGSVMAVTGTFTPAANQSVSGAVTAPPGSVMTVVTLAGSVMGVSGTFTNPAGSIQSITIPAGSVTAVRTDIASVITTQIAGSIMATSAIQPAGSVLAIVTPAGSVQGVRTDLASVITVFQAPSIVGTYAEDAPSASGDKGFLVMGARNDTLSSITSADGDYSSHVVGPSGELIAANAPLTKWISGTADLRVVLGGSVQVLAAQGTSVFTYITGVQIANMGPSSVLVTLAGGLGSILGYSIAPAGGGSNILYPNALKTGENSKFTASISGTSSVLVSAQGFSAKI